MVVFYEFHFVYKGKDGRGLKNNEKKGMIVSWTKRKKKFDYGSKGKKIVKLIFFFTGERKKMKIKTPTHKKINKKNNTD